MKNDRNMISNICVSGILALLTATVIFSLYAGLLYQGSANATFPFFLTLLWLATAVIPTSIRTCRLMYANGSGG